MKIITLIKKYWQLWSYLIFGGLTTLINLAVFNYLYIFMHITSYQVATIVAWVISVVFAFVTNKSYVFRTKTTSSTQYLHELLIFFFYRSLSLLIDFAILKIGIDCLHSNVFLIKLIDNLVVIIINYVFSKIFIFRKS